MLVTFHSTSSMKLAELYSDFDLLTSELIRSNQSNVHSKLYQFGTLFVQKYLAFLKSFDRSDRLCSDKMASSITIMNGIP